jgi:hypothetical protein
MFALLTGITHVAGRYSLYTLRAGAHAFPTWTAFPPSEYYECVRLPLRPQPPSFVLVRPTGIAAGAYRVSACPEPRRRVPDDSLFTCHARLPRRTLGTSPCRFRTVPSVVSSDDVERLLVRVCAFSGLHLAAGVTSPYGLQSSLSTPPAHRSENHGWAIPIYRKRLCIFYLITGKTRYWWMANPSR